MKKVHLLLAKKVNGKCAQLGQYLLMKLNILKRKKIEYKNAWLKFTISQLRIFHIFSS